MANRRLADLAAQTICSVIVNIGEFCFSPQRDTSFLTTSTILATTIIDAIGLPRGFNKFQKLGARFMQVAFGFGGRLAKPLPLVAARCSGHGSVTFTTERLAGVAAY